MQFLVKALFFMLSQNHSIIPPLRSDRSRGVSLAYFRVQLHEAALTFGSNGLRLKIGPW